jgi:hypothetical protein
MACQRKIMKIPSPSFFSHTGDQLLRSGPLSPKTILNWNWKENEEDIDGGLKEGWDSERLFI